MAARGKTEPVDGPQNGNRLIDSLPPGPRKAMLAHCECVELAAGTVLCDVDEPFEHAYFPITGNITLLTTVAGHPSFETQGIGREGMLGVNLILEVNRSPQRGIVQTPCLALRLEAERLRAAIRCHPALRRILQRYFSVVVGELLQTVGCIRFHNVGPRLARGLLLAHDRAPTAALPLTHRILAKMLGVQRGAVTLAALKLQEDGVIRYSHGRIAIIDRTALEAAACECYGTSIGNPGRGGAL
ncbi:Crp/Fnr family transcriptional regulator [Marinobacteraceae bacterium S3BR75-40.1]